MDISALIASQLQQPGFSLQQPFYTDPAIYQREMERIFCNDWVYVCHTSQLEAVGDTQTFDLDNESIIVCRDEERQIQAFANVCRHRGSRICPTGASKNRRLVCPYHAWSYNLDGSLAAARQMPEDFNKADYGLKKLAVEVFCGFVFVNLSAEPLPFAGVREQLQDVLGVFDLENTRLAHHAAYPIAANWKLVFENFYECYHCSPSHREYALSHSLSLDEKRREPHQQQLNQRAAACGISPEVIGYDPDPANPAPQAFYRRYGLYEGYQTGSEDGKPVAPLLGQVKDFDGGAGDVQIGNLTHLLIYADHVVLYRFTPRTVDTSMADMFWFVRKDATKEQVDLERMIWLWHVTTLADTDIIERNQQGMLSRFYQPGPYSLMEDSVDWLVQWYLARMA